MTILELHHFDVIILNFRTCQIGELFFQFFDEELQSELELDFFLSQLPIHTFLSLNPEPLYERLREEIGPS